MRIINPYEGIEFGTAKRVNSISHEHIYNSETLKFAYDRGIRHFCGVHYLPAVPRYPYSNFYYKVENGVPILYQYDDWRDPANDDFTIVDTTFQGSIPSFTDKDGNVINTNDLPQVPNAEHTHLYPQGYHVNFLGSLRPEAGNGNGIKMDMRNVYPTDFETDIPYFYTNENLLFSNKVFGTINHETNLATILRLLNIHPSLFRAVEIRNSGYDDSWNANFRKAFDGVLKTGKRIWCVASMDWQAPELDGCNVLYVPDNYDELPANDFLEIGGKKYANKHSAVYTKAEAGLDSYIRGAFYASGFGTYKIVALEVNGKNIYFEVDGSPIRICAVSSHGTVEGTGNSINFKIKDGMTYVRFEAYYNSGTPLEFIFTQPIFIEDNDGEEANIVLFD